MIFILWCGFGLVHLAITIYLALGYSRYKRSSIENQHSLSIVIAARNEEANLKRLMPRLLDQDYEDFEIIVALDRCTDESLNYLKSLNHKKVTPINIQSVADDWNPKKYALNEAISVAKGDWIVFTDADCVPVSNQWLGQISSHAIDGKEIVIGVSPYLAKGTFLSSFIQFEAFMTAYMYISHALSTRPYMAVGRNMAIKKSLFEASGGYEDIKSIVGGDDDLFIQKNATKSNTQAMLGANTIVSTEPKTTWKAYWEQKIRHLSIGHHYRRSDQLFLSIFHSTHLLALIFLIFSATHSFFFPTLLFYLFIKLVSYRFAASKMGISINYILLPLVDILYALLIPVVSLRSKLEKDIKWKN